MEKYGRNILKPFIINIIWFFPDTYVLKVMAGKHSFVARKPQMHRNV